MWRSVSYQVLGIKNHSYKQIFQFTYILNLPHYTSSWITRLFTDVNVLKTCFHLLLRISFHCKDLRKRKGGQLTKSNQNFFSLKQEQIFQEYFSQRVASSIDLKASEFHLILDFSDGQRNSKVWVKAMPHIFRGKELLWPCSWELVALQQALP